MTRTTTERAGAIRAATVIALLAIASSIQCADVDRGLGEACIRNEDCLSGTCAGQVCVAQATVLDAAPSPRATVVDSSSPEDAAADGGPDVVNGDDAASPGDAASKDAAEPLDAPADAHRASG